MTGTCMFNLQPNISTRTLHASSNPTLYNNVQTFSTGLSGGPVVLDEPTLTEMVGGSQYMNVAGMTQMVEKYFVPMGVHYVVLDIGWMDGNTVNSSVLGTFVLGGYQQWIADWLTVSQEFGIDNIFFTKQFGYFFAPGWDTAFLQVYPGAQTVDSQGVPVPLSNCAGCTNSSGWSIASPFVYQQMAQDLKQLYIWYGSYSSWIGIGEGATGDRNYYANTNNVIKITRPFDNATIQAYANSPMFRREITSEGYYIGTNVLSEIYQMFIAKTKSFNTTSLANEIMTYDNNSYSGGSIVYPLVGWNSFLNYEQAYLEYNLTQLLASYGKHMVVFTGLPVQIAESIPNVNLDFFLFANSGAGGPIGCSPSQSSCGGTPTFWADDAKSQIQNTLSLRESTYSPWYSFGNTQDNQGSLTPLDLRVMYLTDFVLVPTNPLGMNDWMWGTQYNGINDMIQNVYTRSFGGILNRMVFSGSYYGSTSGLVRVLWIGDSEDGFFPEFLTPAVSITWASSSDSNLTEFGSFNQFNVIVGSPTDPTQSFEQRLQNFVDSGGGVVETSFGDSPNVQNNLLGLETTNTPVSTTSSLSILSSNEITAPYSSISYNPYWVRYQIIPLSGASPQILVQDSNGNPVVAVNKYGSGLAVLLEQPYARLSYTGNPPSFDGVSYGSPRDSFVTLMINAILYAAGKGNLAPVIWESNYNGQQNWSPYLQFSVDGSPGGPVLLWLSNNGSTASPFDIHLSANFYGLGGGWVAIDVLDMSVVAAGTGNDIHISTTVPAYSWLPIYLVKEGGSYSPIYSTARILSVSSNSNGVAISTSSSPDSSQWLVLNVGSVSSVSSSLSGPLPYYSSSQGLNATMIGYSCTSIASDGSCGTWVNNDQEGWYVNNQGLLFVHYEGDGTLTLSISSGSGSPPPPPTQPPAPSSVQLTFTASPNIETDGSNITLEVNYGNTQESFDGNQLPVTLDLQPGSTVTYNFSEFVSSLSNSSWYYRFDYAQVNSSQASQSGQILVDGATTVSAVYLQGTIQSESLSTGGNGGSASNQSGSNSGQSENNTGQLSSKLYTLTILSGPVGFGSTSPDTGTYQLTVGTSVNITALPVKGWGLGSWFVDGNYAGNGSSLTIKMLSDTTVVALFTELTSSLPSGTVSISTDIANTTAIVDGKKYVLPVSFSWPIGTIHNISVDSLIQLSDNEQILFSNWTGAVTSNSNSISVNVQGDSFVLANHVIKYRVELKFVDSIGMPVKPDLAELSYNQGSLQLNRSFIFWAPVGITFTFIGVKWDGTGIKTLNNSNTFTVMAPGSITIKLNIHPQAFKVQDILGEPIAGAEVVVQLPNGTKIQEITNSSGLAYFPQLPPQGYQAIVSYIGSTLTLYPDQDTSGIQYVTFALSYPVIGAIVAVMASLGLSLSFNKIKKIISPSLKGQKQEIAD